MKNLGKWLASALCLVLLFLVFSMSSHRHGSREVRADVPGALGEIGGRLPDFTLSDIDGNQVRLSQFYGHHPVVLAFERSLDW